MSESHSILIVDDDTFIGSMVARLMQDAGYTVRQVDTGEAAIEEVKKEQPDLMVLDIGLPGIDGYEVMKALKGDPQTQSVPIIVLSNFGQQEEIDRSIGLGAVTHYVKANLEPREIVEKVRTFFATS